MAFVRKDMSFVHYRWNEQKVEGEEVFTGEPSRRSFDPFNGDQVLYMINCCASEIEGFSLADARAIESEIAYKLPEDLKSERSVFQWIIQTMREADTKKRVKKPE